MRPNNSNKRLRGRNRTKNTNPLARSYESNGPDVKIRGSALQVADKYAQLARDAQSSGDRVMAENYFQHAEHYYRIVATAYEQQGQQRREEGDRPRDERPHRGSGDQPPVNGFDGMEDDDEGVRRALKMNGSANGRSHEDEEPEAAPAPPPAPVVVDASPAEEEPAEATEAAAEPEEAPKPKRRARTPRRPRTRRADADGTAAAPEASEPS
ncbi:MAG: DUF4167 domain-containing protein [Pseudomonadota bacterium]